jgi:segregation and condensation protein A
MSYKVRLDIFEGPFDLLVYLIENAEMSIYDIQVSEITSQYLEYVDQMKTLDIALAGEFMVLAAALIEIKSKMLLPKIQVENEDLIEEDPRATLVQQILEYKEIKRGAYYLAMQEEQAQRIFTKPKEDLSYFMGEPEEYINLDLNQFIKTFHTFLQKKRKLEEIQKNYTKIERQKVTLESKISYIKNQFFMKKRKKLRFTELLSLGKDRHEVILTFLSLLEMVRQKSITVKQHINFGEITLHLDKSLIPAGAEKNQNGGEENDY